MQFDEGDHRFRILGCRHGLTLIYHASRDQLLVWDPVNGDRHNVDIPPGFNMTETQIHGAVLQAAGDTRHFQVVLVGNDEKQYTRALACTYSSENGAWGNLISTLLPPKPKDCRSRLPTTISLSTPSVLVGDSLYWFLAESSASILEFDLGFNAQF
ncbi:hypothetical protein BRADI_3g04705v3 [Brachypodium distachyon]|uniref:F-box associated domain-containing protein n=1 Tax=Brachypodium distachyon TaxID=15368 RepID=A0A2K2CV93_BRADI|nr:hypothetical protein BRADI_3g04705v3 [Brachypodium distachyon]